MTMENHVATGARSKVSQAPTAGACFCTNIHEKSRSKRETRKPPAQQTVSALIYLLTLDPGTKETPSLNALCTCTFFSLNSMTGQSR
jgi:hypothetical protein